MGAARICFIRAPYVDNQRGKEMQWLLVFPGSNDAQKSEALVQELSWPCLFDPSTVSVGIDLGRLGVKIHQAHRFGGCSHRYQWRVPREVHLYDYWPALLRLIPTRSITAGREKSF